jgi:cytoskeletal protein RodZ
MPTIGEKLEETRLRHGLTVEDVAHETHIHPNMLLRIEEDDFSQFPSVAYAKSFIRKYSEHLGVDLGDAMEALNAGVMRLGDNELMGEMKKTIHKDRRFRLERTPKSLRRRSDKPAGAPLFLNLVLGTLIVSLGLFYFLGYNAPSAQKAKEDIARSLGIELPPAPPAAVDSTVVKTPPGTTPAMGNPPAGAQTDLTIPIDNPLGSPAPVPPTTPGVPPVYPPIKPAVDVSFDDTLKPGTPKSGIAGAAITEPSALPRPRETPRMVISENPVAPPSAARVPAAGSPTAEPQPTALPVDPPAVKPTVAPVRALPVPDAE